MTNPVRTAIERFLGLPELRALDKQVWTNLEEAKDHLKRAQELYDATRQELRRENQIDDAMRYLRDLAYEVEQNKELYDKVCFAINLLTKPPLKWPRLYGRKEE